MSASHSKRTAPQKMRPCDRKLTGMLSLNKESRQQVRLDVITDPLDRCLIRGVLERQQHQYTRDYGDCGCRNPTGHDGDRGEQHRRQSVGQRVQPDNELRCHGHYSMYPASAQLIGNLLFRSIDVRAFELIFDGVRDEFVHAAVAFRRGSSFRPCVKIRIQFDSAHVWCLAFFKSTKSFFKHNPGGQAIRHGEQPGGRGSCPSRSEQQDMRLGRASPSRNSSPCRLPSRTILPSPSKNVLSDHAWSVLEVRTPPES